MTLGASVFRQTDWNVPGKLAYNSGNIFIFFYEKL